MPALPARPSIEHLRKRAKRLARERAIRIAEAQRTLALDYGFRTWSELITHVAAVRGEEPGDRRPLFVAIRSGDVRAVRRLIASGANPRLAEGRETSLHAAARVGSLAIVEALVEAGALEWLVDEEGRTPAEVAREMDGPQRDEIVALLDRERIADPAFRDAVEAINVGDVAKLAALLDADTRLLRERIVEPQAYRIAKRPNYFLDPKLFWFVANNPTHVAQMPANVTDVARTMIVRGVEKSDLDYTLGLVMSNSFARDQGLQRPLMGVLLDAGATPTRDAILATAAYHGFDALRALLETGFAMNAPIAATLDDRQALARLLPSAGPCDVQDAFGLAVIVGNVEAARIALDAGADVNAFLPVHSHGTALHTAALGENVAMLDLLLERGAKTQTRDALWDSTPLQWAIHEKRPIARARLDAQRAAETRPTGENTGV